MHIDHINISAPKELLQKVRDFYCEVLGLTEGFRPNFSRGGFWLYSEGKPIHLIESTDHYHNEKQGFFDHFALQATGLAKICDNLDAAGIEYKVSYLSQIDMSQIFCKDPSGTGVEINFLNETV